MEIAYTKNGADLGLAFEIGGQHRGKAFFPAVVLKVREPLLRVGFLHVRPLHLVI